MGICNSQNEKQLESLSKSVPIESTNLENKKNELLMRNKPLSIEPIIKKEQLGMGRKTVPIETANKLSKSICKITYKNMGQEFFGTGFFMIYNSLKCLISVNHVITSNLINKNIEIEIYNKKKFNLQLNSRFIKFFERPIDISVIEIKDSDGINEYIEYLKHDLNYMDGGYTQYKGKDVLSLGYPFGETLSAGTGKIKDINKYEFDHDIPTEIGSSGSPIILFYSEKILGIHKYGNEGKNINVATFIGEIFNIINKDLNKENNKLEIKWANENKNNKKVDKNININEKYILNLSGISLGNEGIQNLIKYNNIIKELNLSINNISDIGVLEKVKFDKLAK